MTKSIQTQAQAMLTEYQNMYVQRYGKIPPVNRFRDKYPMGDVLEYLGEEETLELLRYYFSTSKNGHPLQFFFYNYDKLQQAKEQRDADRKRTERLLEETQKRVEEST